MPTTRRQYPGNFPVQPIETHRTIRRKFRAAVYPFFLFLVGAVFSFLPKLDAFHEHAPANLLVVQAAERLSLKVTRKHLRVFFVVER
jgi:predicted acyltransferase